MFKYFIFILFFIFLVICLVTSYIGYTYLSQKDHRVTNTVSLETFIINKGDTFKDISESLQKSGFIKDTVYFEYYQKFERPDITFNSGIYRISKSMNYKEIIDVLIAKPIETSWTVRYIEGLRYDEVLGVINTKMKKVYCELESKNLFIDKSGKVLANCNKLSSEFYDKLKNLVENPKDVNHPIFSKIEKGDTLEGFLFPDTYTFEIGISAEELLNIILNNFENKWDKAVSESGQSSDKMLGKLNSYQKLVFASIVEKEGTGKYEENSKIAATFYNRLSINMPLQSDVTIVYPKKDWKHSILLSELNDTADPYNTHRISRLPPTPICNMGYNSILATLKPAIHDYLFFIADKNGIVRYAKTYEEHNKNIKLYGLSGE